MPNDDAPRLPRIGVALSAGSARGWAHVGVLRELSALGIPIHSVCGCSSGALVAACHAAGKLSVLENLAEEMSTVRLLRFLDIGWKRGGIIHGRWLINFFRNRLGERSIEDLETRFACVATEFHTNREIWLRRGSLIDAVRASIALPGLLPPIELDGRILMDGAVVNPLPVALCRALGAEIVIGVNLVEERPGGVTDAAVDTADHKGGWWSRVSGGANGRAPSDAAIPSSTDIIADSIFAMQGFITRVRLATDPPDVLIEPDVSGFGALEFQRAPALIGRGVAAVRREQPRLEGWRVPVPTFKGEHTS